MPEAERAARPSETTFCTTSVSASRAASAQAGSGSGQGSMWMLTGAPERTRRARFWWIASATMGMNGAMSRFAVVRHSYRVR